MLLIRTGATQSSGLYQFNESVARSLQDLPKIFFFAVGCKAGMFERMSHAATYRPFQLWLLGLLAMLAFAANSLLCRLALKDSHIDPASFTSIRILAGALMLLLLTGSRSLRNLHEGSWLGAGALFVYAAAFSYAYINLPASTGALLLFGAVQFTMIGYGIWAGEHLTLRQLCGLGIAIAGLVLLLLPGLTTPHPGAAALMVLAGLAWGTYTLLGKRSISPMEMTFGNFVRCIPLAMFLSIVTIKDAHLGFSGILFAVISGAIASGIGYMIWYQVVRDLKATSAAVMQLSVPVITAIGGVILLFEPITLRLWVASCAVLGGIALVMISIDQTRS